MRSFCGEGYNIIGEIADYGLKANGGEKKYYSLTREGKDMLEKMKNFWENYKDCVDGFMKGDA